MSQPQQHYNWYAGITLLNFPFHFKQGNKLLYPISTFDSAGTITTKYFGKRKFQKGNVLKNFAVVAWIKIPESERNNTNLKLFFEINKETMIDVSQNDWIKLADNFIDPDLNMYTRNFTAPFKNKYKFESGRAIPQKIFKDVTLEKFPGFNLTWYSNFKYRLDGASMFRDFVPNRIFARY